MCHVKFFVHKCGQFHCESLAFYIINLFLIRSACLKWFFFFWTEWQKALYSIGGSEVKKWPLQLRRASPDGLPTNSNGASLQQQEMDRSLPSSPNPLYSPPSKSSGFMKGGLGQNASRKQLIGGPAVVDSSRGSLQWVQSISFVSVSIDHSLQPVSQADAYTGKCSFWITYPYFHRALYH